MPTVYLKGGKTVEVRKISNFTCMRIAIALKSQRRNCAGSSSLGRILIIAIVLPELPERL